MTKEEAIKLLGLATKPRVTKEIELSVAPDVTDKFLEAINMAIKALEAEPPWIPVAEDTLPEEGRIVVVYGEKGTWDFGTYRGHGNDIHYWHWKKNTFKRVYWWMYKEDALPEPYKGVTE